MIFTTLSHAKDWREDIDSTLDKCKQEAISTIDSHHCYVAATYEWDSELQKQYNLLMEDQPENVRIALRNSQRQWIKYRDAYNQGIEAFYQKKEGTIWSLIAAESKMNIVRDKTLDLYRLKSSLQLSSPINLEKTNVTTQTPEEQYQLGKNLLDKKSDLNKAIELLTKSADSGNDKAQQVLGYTLVYSDLLPQNISKGLSYTKKSALQNNPNAQIDLGYAYSKGIGVPVNHDTALFWYEKAKSNGSSIADKNIKAIKIKAQEEEKYKNGFIAIINCGPSEQGGPSYIDNCFNDSELKITLDNISTIYDMKSGNYPSQSGEWKNDGLHIKLTKKFSITAQNSLPVEMLTIKIKDQSGNVIFQDQASQYQFIKVKND